MTAKQLRALIAKREGETLEIQDRMPRRGLARLLAGFANADGGKLVFGYDESAQTPSGIEREDAQDRLQYALNRVEPPLHVQPEFVAIDGKEVLVIDVPAGPAVPYLVQGGAPVRRGDDVVDLTSAEILELAAPHLQQREDDATQQRVLRALDKIEKRGSWKRVVPLSIGGVILGYILKAWDPLANVF